jgi:recombination protein RecA
MGISKEKLNALQKTFGQGAIMKMDDAPKLDLKYVSSGSLDLNHALGGGFPLGRIVEIYGPESSGKTTLAIHAIAEAQKDGLVCAFVDAEHAFDREYAKNLGVDTSELLISQPDSGEQALDLVDNLIDTKEVSVIVVDSTSALTPKSELEGEMTQSAVGTQARMLSKGLRKITAKAQKNGCLIIFISQMREKIGVMFGSPEVVGVGNAMKFYASQRVDVRRSTQVKDKESGEAEGNLTRAKVVKNKVAPPFRVAEYVIRYGIGIDKEQEIFDLAVAMNIIEKAGSWFSYSGAKLGQGGANVLEILKDNPQLMEELNAQVIEGLKQQ